MFYTKQLRSSLCPAKFTKVYTRIHNFLFLQESFGGRYRNRTCQTISGREFSKLLSHLSTHLPLFGCSDWICTNVSLVLGVLLLSNLREQLLSTTNFTIFSASSNISLRSLKNNTTRFTYYIGPVSI